MVRLIDRARSTVVVHGASCVIDAATRRRPRRLGPGTFALAADLLLVNGRLERTEARFLGQLGLALGLKANDTRQILKTLQIKNSL